MALNLNHYANPEELKGLAAFEWSLANGGNTVSGQKVVLPLRPDPGVKERVTDAILSTSRKLPIAANKEKARQIIVHFVFVLGDSLVLHGPETAYNVAEILLEEAGHQFVALEVPTAMDEFERALVSRRESDLLQCTRSIWQ